MAVHSSVNRWIAAIRKGIDEEFIDPFNEAVGEGSIDAYNAAIGMSPVCTGRFRSAWRVTLNVPSRGNPKIRYRCNPNVRHDRYANELNQSERAAHKSASRFDIRKGHKGLVLSNNVAYTNNIRDIDKMISVAKEKAIAPVRKLGKAVL